MNKSKSIFKRVIKSAFLVVILVGLSNCNQFHSFSGSEKDAHLSKAPVFEEPSTSYNGPDERDEGEFVPENPEQPEEPKEPIVVVDTPTPLEPFKFCPDGRFQVLQRDGTYTKCRPCVAQGVRLINGQAVPICEVQRCDQTNQYIFFGNDVDYPSRNCERCDVLSNDQTRCDIVVEPPVVTPPVPPVIDIPEVETCETNPNLPHCPKTPETPTETGGDGGGDGGGDPLMIDSVGEMYHSEADLMDDDYNYFERGTLQLTNPNPIAGVEQDKKDIERRQKFEGFNLLGRQTQTVLDDGTFLHINTTGQGFKFKKMSWTRTDQNRYRFLVLPDHQGRVLGIDQLFGDNTFGPNPHKPFAKDGFHALMKYDRGGCWRRR